MSRLPSYLRFKPTVQNNQASRTKKALAALQKRQRDRIADFAALRAARAINPPAYQRQFMMRLEKKAMDTFFNQVNILSQGANSNHIVAINLIAPGSSSCRRIGRKTDGKSIRLRLNCQCVWPSTADTYEDMASRNLRIVIVHDRQPNGSLPTKGQIFAIKEQDDSESFNWLAPISFDNMKRFKILRDDMVEFNPGTRNHNGAGTNSFSVTHNYDMYLKTGIKTNYSSDSTPAVIGDVSTGAVYVIFLTERGLIQNAAVEGSVNVLGFSRYSYLDQ